MNIYVFEVRPWENDFFEQLREGNNLVLSEQALNESNVHEYRNAEIISVITKSRVVEDVLSKLPALKLITTRTTGFDHIDLDYCNENGIMVSNVPFYGDVTVAEHVFALILAISRHIPEAVNRTRRGDFSLAGLQGFDLYGKTIGVVGTGSIGKNVIRIAHGFRMNIVAYDVVRNERMEQIYELKYVEMDELLSIADIVTLHVPANKETENLISEREFGLMKKGAILINTARGSVVDTKALLRALAEGKLAAAGLDVLPEEPAIKEETELLNALYENKYDTVKLLADCALIHNSNVVITPHSAFNTREAVSRIHETTVENIRGFLGGEPRNVVNKVIAAVK